MRSSTPATSSPASIRIYNEDNGPGIPAKDREQLFTVFKRLHRHEEVEGTGLGLSICKRIVTQYGGSITVEDSKRLGGAKFVVTLPSAETPG